MAHSQPLNLLLFCVLLLLLLTNPPPALSQLDELYFAGFRPAGGDSNITLDGAATVEPNGLLRLTDNTLRVFGHAFYRRPVRFKNSSGGEVVSFSAAFAFAIVPEYPRLGGHGLAFTVSPARGLPGALPSQYLGLLNSSDMGNLTDHVFAVEFDTVQDFEFGDIDGNHVGIDIDSLTSNASAPAAVLSANSTKQPLNLKSGKVIQAWIDYDSTQKQISVSLSPSSTKPKSPILSYNVDLSPILREEMYIGFSSSTGLLASTHYILGWSFKINGEARSLSLNSLPKFPKPRKSRTVLIATVSVSAVLILFLLMGFSFFIIRRIKNAEVIEPWELDIGPHRFSYRDLKIATRNFRDRELIGFGGFGKVYKGTLPNTSTEVAVKRISHESKQGLQEFASEIASIGRLRHRNLVQLLGWCRRGGDLILVYDFMPNGSLDKYLFQNPRSVLTWEQRLKIVKGVASGLLYLHEEWEQAVIHRDVKAGNVLLDEDLNGRLGDFGLAKLYEHGSNPSTTRVVGTLGYLAPELTRTGKPTASSDVFAFGALLLEIVCGRRPIEPKAMPEELILVDWAWEKWAAGEVAGIVDPRLEGGFDESEVGAVVKLGLMCSNNWPEGRPTMRQVVRYLEGEAELPEVVAPPDKRCNAAGGFEDYVNSGPASSYFEKVSTWSSAGDDGEVDVEAGSGFSRSVSGAGDRR